MTSPSQPRWPNPGPDGRLKEKHLPAHLGQTNLNDTYERARGNTIALFGHSIVDYNKDVSQSSGTPPVRYSRGDSFFNWMNAFLRQRFTLKGVYGYPGYTAAQLKAQTGPAKASGARYVMVFAGINSLTQEVSAPAIVADLNAIVSDFLGNGQVVILCTDWPATTLTTNAQKDAYADVTRWIVAQSARPGVIVVPWHHALTDVSTGNPRAGALADGTHPLTFGAMLAGREAARILDPIIPSLGSGELIASNVSRNNALSNGMMLGATGTTQGATATGAVADGWQLEVTSGSQAVAGSKVARSDGYGEWQQLQVTAGTGSANMTSTLSRTQALPTGWVAGDSVYAEIEFEADADFSNASTLQLALWQLNASWANQYISWGMRDSNGTTDVKRLGGVSGILRTPAVSLLSGVTQLQFRVGVNRSTDATGPATIRFGRARIGRVLPLPA